MRTPSETVTSPCLMSAGASMARSSTAMIVLPEIGALGAADYRPLAAGCQGERDARMAPHARTGVALRRPRDPRADLGLQRVRLLAAGMAGQSMHRHPAHTGDRIVHQW